MNGSSGRQDASQPAVVNETRPATKAELLNFFQQLEKRLVDSGFLRMWRSGPACVRNIRNLFQRAGLTHQEVRTLHGIVSDLSALRERRNESRTWHGTP